MTTQPRPPRHLSAESKKLWRQLHERWRFRPDEEATLTIGLEALDLVRRCQAEIEANGLVIPSRDGLKANPAAVILAGARKDFMAAMRMLGLGDVVVGLDRSTAAAANAAALRAAIARRARGG